MKNQHLELINELAQNTYTNEKKARVNRTLNDLVTSYQSLCTNFNYSYL